MKKQIDVTSIMNEIFAIGLEKSEKSVGDRNYPYAYGWMIAQTESILNELELSTKQKKVLQARLDEMNSTRTKKVKNLMTGEMIEIPYDTPRSCDPSSELYWSM